MHGHNINLPVSVCPSQSHFLSTRLQVKTPQRIFAVDSLKNADLRKDVPFGALGDEQSHLGVQSPPKNLFLGPSILSQICEKFK